MTARIKVAVCLSKGDRLTLVLPALVAAASGCSGLEAHARAKAQQINATEERTDLPYQDQVSAEIALARTFSEKELSPANLRKYSTPTVKGLLKAVGTISFYKHGENPYLGWQEQVFEELVVRHGQTDNDVEDLFQRYLSARRLDKASLLKERFPAIKLWALPRIVDTTDTTKHRFRVYDVSADSATATVKYIPLDAGPRIVMSAWYACSVSAKALKYMAGDRQLLQAMHDHGIILTGRFEPGGAALRNTEVPFTRTYIAYTEADWPGIDFRSSPTFYFFEDGKLMHSFVGADTKETFSIEFRRGLAAMGLQLQ